ncbi:hypothetical protein PV325_006072 [Microctonus aethiopoides]|nr:hypothetical protein PV325_006072 [Microctonus aethiopoides]
MAVFMKKLQETFFVERSIPYKITLLVYPYNAQVHQPVSTSSMETSRARQDTTRRMPWDKEGLTDTWTFNGANLRAHGTAVTLLIR